MHCRLNQRDAPMPALAEQPAYGIRVVAERNNRSNDGCVEMATGGSWPTAEAPPQPRICSIQTTSVKLKLMKVALVGHFQVVVDSARRKAETVRTGLPRGAYRVR